MCVVGTIHCDDHTQVVMATCKTFFGSFFSPSLSFIIYEVDIMTIIIKSQLMKGLGCNKHTTLGENTIKSGSPLAITRGI